MAAISYAIQPGSAVEVSNDDAVFSFDSDQQVKLLDQKHPDYAANLEAWVDLTFLREGGVAIKRHASRLLKQRPKEDMDVFTARVERFTYQNILGTALGWYVAAMFENDPEVMLKGKNGEEIKNDSDLGKFYSNFLNNCDGRGTTFDDFIKSAFSSVLTYGCAWILTDLKALAEGEPKPANLQDQRDRGLLDPHLVSYNPMNVINWDCDAEGCLQWVVIKTSKQQQGFLGKPKIVDTWYYYDKTDYYVYRDERKLGAPVIQVQGGESRTAKFIATGKHALANQGRVPIRKLTLVDDLWLANRAYLLLIDHLNQDNTLAWSLFMSNLAIPVIIGDVDTNNMAQSETGFLQFPAGTTYQWTEPQGKSFEQSANRIESLREEAFRCMYLTAQGRSMHATPAMQSGRSKQLEMEPAKDTLTGMGGSIRLGMQNVLVDVKDAHQDGDKVIPDVRGFIFEDDMTTEEVFAVESVLAMKVPSKTFEKTIYKRVAHAWMPDANREEMQKVNEEIEAGPTRDEREKQEQQERIDLAKAGMSSALTKKPGGSALPPGRGGSGPSPRAK